MPSTVISYPIPIYQNVPIHDEYYLPTRFVISNIDIGTVTIVTTALPHNFVVGQEVRLLVPNGYGSTKLSGISGLVIEIPSTTQVTLDIFSIGVDPFISASLSQQPQIIPIGDVNSGKINASGRIMQGTFIPGNFLNISPL